MGRQSLPANGTQTKNVRNKLKMCIKTVINARLKKINSAIKSIKEINSLTALLNTHVPLDLKM